MGLIKAALGAAGGTLADQWKEFFTCDSMDKDTLMVRGVKQQNGRTSNTKGHDNVITNGSGIAVADGQCMLIVDQGQVVEICAEPGEFTYDSSKEPTIFEGPLGKSIIETFKTMGKRFTYGGDTGRDQRVYYINTKEILENKFGTANPIPFRVVDRNIGFDVDLTIRCNGVYSYKIADPIVFYTKIASNVAESYTRDELDKQMKTEFIDALAPALAQISAMQVRPSEIPLHKKELVEAMNTELSADWMEKRGITIVSIGMNPITLTEEDQAKLSQAQTSGMYRDPSMAGAALVGAQADAMRSAASNPNGAMAGFMGMGMAGAMGGAANAQGFFQMAGQQQQPMGGQPMGGQPMGGQPMQQQPVQQQAAPAAEGWTCECGAVNQDKFCQNCGKQKPAGAPLYKCDKCGWTPPDPHNPPKFCPECGDVFDANDIQQ